MGQSARSEWEIVLQFDCRGQLRAALRVYSNVIQKQMIIVFKSYEKSYCICNYNRSCYKRYSVLYRTIETPKKQLLNSERFG